MKTKVILLTLFLGASTCLLKAQDSDQRPPPRDGGPGGPGVQRPMNPMVLALDLNHDGTIDADEIAKASVSLKKLDRNGDGNITPEEYRPRHPGGPGGPGGRGPEGRGPRGPGGGEDYRPQHPKPE